MNIHISSVKVTDDNVEVSYRKYNADGTYDEVSIKTDGEAPHIASALEDLTEDVRSICELDDEHALDVRGVKFKKKSVGGLDVMGAVITAVRPYHHSNGALAVNTPYKYEASEEVGPQHFDHATAEKLFDVQEAALRFVYAKEQQQAENPST